MFVVYPCAHTELKKISVYTFSDSCYANDIYGIAFFILLFAGVHILYMYYIYIYCICIVLDICILIYII